MKIYDTLLEYGIPCFIFCRNLQPDPEFLEKAVKNNIPVFITDKQTSSFSAELIRWMKWNWHRVFQFTGYWWIVMESVF